MDIKKFDLLALYSPSDVKAILERFPAEELPAVATFGEGTLRAAVDVGIKVKAMAPTPTVPSMAKAVDIYLTKLAKGEQIEDVAVTHDADKEEFIRTQQHKLAKKSRTRRTTPAEKKSRNGSVRPSPVQSAIPKDSIRQTRSGRRYFRRDFADTDRKRH